MLAAGDVWFHPIETGVRERMRGFIEPSRANGCAISLSSPDIEELIGHRLDVALRRGAPPRLSSGFQTCAKRGHRELDLVIIPSKGSALDAVEAYKAVKFIRFQEKNYRQAIPFAILFTQTSAAIRPRTMTSIEAEFAENKVPVFDVQIHERDAYRALFTFGGTLDALDPQMVRNVPAATTNAKAFAAEVIRRLDRLQAKAVA